MSKSKAAQNRVTLGDPVPWFSAPTLTGGSFNLQVAAGRWIVLCFLGSVDDPQAKQELTGLLRDAHLFDEDQMIAQGVMTTPPKDPNPLTEISGPAVSFLADYDRELSRSYGALEMRRSVVLDPMLRAIADIAWDYPPGHPACSAFCCELCRRRRLRRRPLSGAGADRAARPLFRAVRFPEDLRAQGGEDSASCSIMPGRPLTVSTAG